MHASAAENRTLQRMHRERLRDQVAAWGQLSDSAGPSRVESSARTDSNPHRRPRTTPGLCSRELSRKLWHIVPGTLILGLPLVRPFEPFASHLPAVIVASTVVLVFCSLFFAASWTRPRECDWCTSVLAFAATALIPLMIFPAHCEVALTAVAILSLGDGAAALGGQTFGGTRLTWNNRKTFAGTVAFVLCAAPAAAWVYWANADPAVSFRLAATGALIAVLVAAAAESIPSPLNDNIRVGAAAMLSVVLMHWWCS